jgi:hypothetical protein
MQKQSLWSGRSCFNFCIKSCRWEFANGQNIGFTGSLSRLAGETVVGGPAIGQNTVANSNYTITYVGGEPCHSGNQYLTYRYAVFGIWII